MSGFYTRTPAGKTIHINGDINMSSEMREKLGNLVDSLSTEGQACLCHESDVLYTSIYGSDIKFNVRRCKKCEDVTVEVLGNVSGDSEDWLYLQTLPTRVAPYHTCNPHLGQAYYWRFHGLNHSTPPIAPDPKNMEGEVERKRD